MAGLDKDTRDMILDTLKQYAHDKLTPEVLIALDHNDEFPTKVLHELGHGLACRLFGGECHEIGVMLLVGTPCLYCNVSDSWLLPDKWKRAAIGAAGMYVELVLA